MGQNSRRAQRVGGYRRIGIEFLGVDSRLDAAHIDLIVFDRVRLVEAALRQPAIDRHLAAFETRLGAARTCRLALAAAPRGLAQPRADAAAKPFARMPGAL